jgi:hypothetical protein
LGPCVLAVCGYTDPARKALYLSFLAAPLPPGLRRLITSRCDCASSDPTLLYGISRRGRGRLPGDVRHAQLATTWCDGHCSKSPHLCNLGMDFRYRLLPLAVLCDRLTSFAARRLNTPCSCYATYVTQCNRVRVTLRYIVRHIAAVRRSIGLPRSRSAIHLAIGRKKQFAGSM